MVLLILKGHSVPPPSSGLELTPRLLLAFERAQFKTGGSKTVLVPKLRDRRKGPSVSYFTSYCSSPRQEPWAGIIASTPTTAHSPSPAGTQA